MADRTERNRWPGRVVAVCLRPKDGIPKFSRAVIRLGPHGVAGDFHAGAKRRSFRTGKFKPNDRQVSVVGRESIDALNARLGVSIPPGEMAENIMVEGFGNLSILTSGDRFLFQGGRSSKRPVSNEPCESLRIWHKLLPKEAFGRRGVVGIVVKEGTLRPGVGVRLVKAGKREVKRGCRVTGVKLGKEGRTENPINPKLDLNPAPGTRHPQSGNP
jgi:hypothetical protein